MFKKHNIIGKFLLGFLITVTFFILGNTSIKAGCNECTKSSQCGTGYVCKNTCCILSTNPTNPPTKDNPFGNITPPDSVSKYTATPGRGVGSLIQIAIWVLIVVAGIYALFNFILAGYGFLSAGDDAKKIAGAWAKIWQTALGLTVAAGSLVLARIFGQLIFGDPTFIMNLRIPTI